MTRAAADGTAAWPPPALDPAGPFAGPLNTLSWVLFGMFGAVLLIVVIALVIALFGPRRWRARLGGQKLVWIGGVACPVVVLSALLVYGLGLTSHLTQEPGPGEMRVRVTGEMWWWRVAYLDDQGREAVQDANELHIPTGRPVVIELDSADVIHSFWVPRLSGKVDMIPGRRNLIRIQADAPGAYGGQCAESWGGPHALLGFVVVAHEPAEYAAWLARQSAPSPAALQPMAGSAVFARAGCGACHTVAGTAFNGQAGPDLSHVGSRRTLGAGILPNNQGTMAGWISDSQSLKPGNRMPSYAVLSGQDVRAVAAYLESLK